MAALKENSFVNIPFTTQGLDRYTVRTSILRAIQLTVSQFKGKLLDAGCGKMPYRKLILESGSVDEYIGLDIESAISYDQKVKPDFVWDGKIMPFADQCFDCCIATEVLEHCPEAEIFLKEAIRVLKPGGLFFFTVPFLWNLHEVPHDEYRYTPFSLQRHLHNSGFNSVEIKAMGGWHASMAQMLGLWVRRSGLSRISRIILSVLFMPIIKLLLQMDETKSVKFENGSMITGLYGTARKSVQ